MDYIQIITHLFKENLLAINFTLGSIFIFLLIIYIDQLIQTGSNKNKINFDLSDDKTDKTLDKKESLSEFDRGLKSLQEALDDNILTNEEYEKFKADLITKYNKN